MYKNTVIHVWTNNCVNKKFNKNDTSSYWGLGDLIRGTIKLYQLKNIMKFNLIVDISLHPISNFLINSNHNYKEFINENKNNIKYFYINELKSNLMNILKNIDENSTDAILLTTNDNIIETLTITDDCKQFIKNIFTPKTEFQNYINNYLYIAKNITIKNIISNVKIADNNEFQKHQESDFNIFHFRFGDTWLVNYDKNVKDVNKDIDKTYKNFLNRLEDNNIKIENNDIILTDSYNFKTYIIQNTNYNIIPTQICHLGIENVNFDSIRDTLLDLFLLIHAKKIKTYSIYNWISGFVHWISIIYDIELISLKNNIK